MNPFYEAGTICIGPACGAYRDFHKHCNTCDPCHKSSYGYPEPISGIDKVAGKAATYRFNLSGKTVAWDFKPGIYEGQTDTSLIVDIIGRLLRFSAERHTDSITAEQLGSILHLNDLGDVSTKNADNGSMMVYKKNDTCPAGCFGTNNTWEPWNALDEQVSSAAYAFGFDADGLPVSIQQPANPNQYYDFGWHGANQLGFSQTVEASDFRLDADGYYYMDCIDPNTKEHYYVKRKP